jgi:hypothetical protein
MHQLNTSRIYYTPSSDSGSTGMGVEENKLGSVLALNG